MDFCRTKELLYHTRTFQRYRVRVIRSSIEESTGLQSSAHGMDKCLTMLKKCHGFCDQFLRHDFRADFKRVTGFESKSCQHENCSWKFVLRLWCSYFFRKSVRFRFIECKRDGHEKGDAFCSSHEYSHHNHYAHSPSIHGCEQKKKTWTKYKKTTTFSFSWLLFLLSLTTI